MNHHHQPMTRRYMHHLTSSRSRAFSAAILAAGTLAIGACKTDRILNATAPDVLPIDAYNTPDGADPLRYGVISDFVRSFDGNIDAFTVISGTLADEIYASDTFDDRLSVNARRPVEINGIMESEYRHLQQTHFGAIQAATVLAAVAPTKKFQRAEMYLLRGFTEIFFAEGWCS